MRIGLTFDLQTDPSDERQAECDPPSTVDAVHRALESLGHDVVRLGNAGDLLNAPHRLREADLVCNLAEGLDARCREAWVPTLLELFEIPYVGSDPLALMVGLDKVMTKRLAVADGVATPRWMNLPRPPALPSRWDLTFPLIVKPRYEGSGRGIDRGAIVHTPEALARRTAWLSEHCPGPLVAEEFIAGGELTVFLIGNDPPSALPVIQRPLDPESGLSHHVVTPPPDSWVAPLAFTDAMERSAQQVAVTMCRAVSCRDMARVDVRVDDAGRVWFLEINPLPSFDPTGSLGLLAELLGRSYAALIGQILEAALKRLRQHERV